MQILSLLSSIFKAGLRARPALLCLLHFMAQAIVFLLEVASSPLGNAARLSLIMKVLTCLFGPLLINEDLLSDLRQKSKGLIKENGE